MKSIKVDLPSSLEKITIHVFADWHIGDHGCDMAKIKEDIKSVEEDPAAFVILNGDLMNNATKTSVSDSYAEEVSPMEAVTMLVDLLSPIKKKILMMMQGNHEARTYRNDGIDLSYIVANELGVEDRYCREGGVMFLRFGALRKDRGKRVAYTIYATHGSGGGRKEGAKAIRLADMTCIVDCDIYIHSHTHMPFVMRESSYRLSEANSSISRVEKLFVNTAAKLEYGGYAQTNEYKPASTISPIITLSGVRKQFTASL